MRNRNLRSYITILAAGVVLSGCDGLGKMAKNAGQVSYTVTPNPLELHGDSVPVTITGNYPAKYFNKKVSVALTPVLRYAGGETEYKTVHYKGESSPAEGTIIPYDQGGSFTYNDGIPYAEAMANSELYLKIVGSKGSKTKEFPEVKLADGVITTPSLLARDNKPSLGADKFTKTVPVNYNGDIHFVVNQANIRPTELREDDIAALSNYLKTGVANNYIWNGVNISAYASPDGEERLNEGLAQRRAENTASWLRGEFRKARINAATQEGFFKTSSTPEDWEGFRKLMQESAIADKDLILRVLNMYQDPAQREREIKNMAATYTVIADEIMPKLRRSVITINAEMRSRSDEQITALVTSNPDSLSVEELLYAATLTEDPAHKLSIYQAAERQYPNDWRTVNNVGYAYVLQNNLTSANTQFEKADKMSPNNPVIKNNLGLIAHMQDNRERAAELYAAAGDDPNARYNLGILKFQQGDYAAAVSNMASLKTYNTALAQTMNGSYDAALTTLENSPDKSTARGHYLKAIIGARKGDKNLMLNNLKSAISKDASLKTRARTDMDFFRYRTDAEFTAAVN